MSLKKDLINSLNNIKSWEKALRSNVLCSLYNVVLCNNETAELNIRSVHDEDGNEMNITKVFINKEDDSKLYIEYYYLDGGDKITDLITEEVTDFPTLTMISILRMWSKSLEASKVPQYLRN